MNTTKAPDKPDDQLRAFVIRELAARGLTVSELMPDDKSTRRSPLYVTAGKEYLVYIRPRTFKAKGSRQPGENKESRQRWIGFDLIGDLEKERDHRGIDLLFAYAAWEEETGKLYFCLFNLDDFKSMGKETRRKKKQGFIRGFILKNEDLEDRISRLQSEGKTACYRAARDSEL